MVRDAAGPWSDGHLSGESRHSRQRQGSETSLTLVRWLEHKLLGDAEPADGRPGQQREPARRSAVHMAGGRARGGGGRWRQSAHSGCKFWGQNQPPGPNPPGPGDPWVEGAWPRLSMLVERYTEHVQVRSGFEWRTCRGVWPFQSQHADPPGVWFSRDCSSGMCTPTNGRCCEAATHRHRRRLEQGTGRRRVGSRCLNRRPAIALPRTALTRPLCCCAKS